MTFDTDLHQGESWQFTIVRKDADGVELDMTGYTIAGQVRSAPSSDTVAATFSCTLVDSPETSDPNRAVLCVLSAASTIALAPRSAYVYDIHATPPGATAARYLVGGAITIRPRVTR